MVSADDLGRSLRGAVAVTNRRADAITLFDGSPAGLLRSFAALALTLPAFVTLLALEHARLGLTGSGVGLFDHLALALRVGLHLAIACFGLPLAAIALATGETLLRRALPYAVAANWIGIFGLLALAVPAGLFLVGWETRPLALVFTLAFSVVVGHAHWFVARAALGLGSLGAAILASAAILLLLSGSGLLGSLIG